jgi:peroxiredoxin
MPVFSLPDAMGERISVPSALRGRVVLIHFWADWCSSCLKELKGSKGLILRYRVEGFEVLAINLKQRPQETVDWLDRLALNYPVLFDRDGQVAAAFGVSMLPSSYLIDRRGRLQRRIIGEMRPEQLEQLVEQML